jgi:transposase
MLRSEVRRRSDATLSELRSHLADHAQVEVSIPTLGRAATPRLGAQKCLAAAERNNYKRAWFWRLLRSLSHERLIFVDEAGVNTAMTRRFARAQRAERAHDSAPRNYGEQTSLISALGLAWALATMTVQVRLTRSASTLTSRKYSVLACSVAMSWYSTTWERTKQVVSNKPPRCGAQVLWLPPYSPDYSPIENCWSKIKTALRAAKARTREELDKALAKAIELVTKADIQGWFKHCGYSVACK